jgi:hypothetical protein
MTSKVKQRLEWIKKSVSKLRSIEKNKKKWTIILDNQKSLLRAGKYGKVKIIPVPRGNGNIEHYYHFLFDFLLPLSLVIERSKVPLKLQMASFGILTKIATDLYGEHLEIAEKSFEGTASHQLLGMNPKSLKLSYSTIEVFRNSIFKRLELKSLSKNPNKVILIQRDTPNDYYIHDAVKKGAGNMRRSISNHQELVEALKKSIKPEFEFHNLNLENSEFKDQVSLFQSAVLVIGQHGAGLSNIIWMNPGSTVVEFGYENRVHFDRISKAMRHKHTVINTSENHITVNCDEVVHSLTQNPFTQQFFL